MVVAQVSSPEEAEAGARFLAEVSTRTSGVSRLEMLQPGPCGDLCPSAPERGTQVPWK
jgi:hypothetical protein